MFLYFLWNSKLYWDIQEFPDFSWHNIPKWRKVYQMTTKIPIGRKIDQMAINYTNLQNLPQLGFLV
jgi:hypothetical protein